MTLVLDGLKTLVAKPVETPNKVGYPPSYIAMAQRLLAPGNEGHEGDHGFTGQSLEAWKAMRLVYFSGLNAIVEDRPVTPKIQQDAQMAPCPRAIGKFYGETPGGTDAGEVWSSESRAVIGTAYFVTLNREFAQAGR